MAIMFWDFLLFYQISFSPQVKRSGIIYKKTWYIRVASRVADPLKSGPQEMRKYQENLRKISKPHKIIAQRAAQPPPTPPPNTTKKLPKNRNRTPPAVRYSTRKLEPLSNTLSMATSSTESNEKQLIW